MFKVIRLQKSNINNIRWNSSLHLLLSWKIVSYCENYFDLNFPNKMISELLLSFQLSFLSLSSWLPGSNKNRVFSIPIGFEKNWKQEKKIYCVCWLWMLSLLNKSYIHKWANHIEKTVNWLVSPWDAPSRLCLGSCLPHQNAGNWNLENSKEPTGYLRPPGESQIPAGLLLTHTPGDSSQEVQHMPKGHRGWKTGATSARSHWRETIPGML